MLLNLASAAGFALASFLDDPMDQPLGNPGVPLALRSMLMEQVLAGSCSWDPVFLLASFLDDPMVLNNAVYALLSSCLLCGLLSTGV
ncbi:hypothetical protein Nepgr_006712 [Nepenthes gracilis]|uniref:Uncharacterized protein n=1 Tax=Nepenthes gracilis TaxID=150966 RepID=A0AAD3XHK7_NEPGR|nr:hypothetical protein Nepgr_006712 [Nepenthes gracilis]